MFLKQNILSKNKDIHLDHPVQSKQIKRILGHIHSKHKEKDLLKLWQLKFRLQVFMVWIFLQLFFTSNSSIQTVLLNDLLAAQRLETAACIAQNLFEALNGAFSV